MSDARWQFDVSPTTSEAYEAMVIVGRGLLTRRKKTLLIVRSIFTGFFAPLGATLVFWIILQKVGGTDISALRGATIPITIVVFAGVSIWFTIKARVVMAEASVKSHFGRQYHVSLDSSGITVTTDNSRWHSGWYDVSVVRGGKQVLAVGISGIAIAVPRRVFLGPDDATDALSVMQAWQESEQ
jgi:hypothetical protein